jgi:AraC-like DNA-binding protein
MLSPTATISILEAAVASACAVVLSSCTNDGMQTMAFETVARSRTMREFAQAYRQGTGAWITFVPARISDASVGTSLRRMTGLSIVAVPLSFQGQRVAMILTGCLLHPKPTDADWDRARSQLETWGLNSQSQDALDQLAQMPVVTDAQFAGMIGLVEIFARQLSECTGCNAVTECDKEHPAVVTAKEFVLARLTSNITTRDAARHAGLSAYHFCRVFKESTGMTFTEYVTRRRVERAKTLLADPAVRVGQVAYEVGFGSIPQFNQKFKEYVGKSPSQYRAQLPSGYEI